MKHVLTALAAGILFGAGLAISQMTNPAKVLSFLDVAGAWDPSLAFVMGSALSVSALGAWIDRRGAARVGRAPVSPARSGIDGRLLTGAGLFGVGWGLAGFCPGPALASLVTGKGPVLLFVGAMLAGMAAYRLFELGTGDARAPEASP